MVVPFANRKTLNIDKFNIGADKSHFNVSTDEANEKPAEENPYFFLEKDCTQWSLSSSKQSHVSSCSLQLIHSDTDYTIATVPGDWILMWVVNSKGEYDAVHEKIKNGERANGWADGFKFMGRVQAVTRNKSRSASGQLNITYQLMGAGFTELDNQIFYHPVTSKHFNNDGAKMGFWLSLDTELHSLMALSKDKKQCLTTQVVVPRLMKCLLGQASVTGNAGSTYTGPTGQSPSPNSAYLVPDTVAKLVSTKYSKTYDRLLRCYVGVQKYSGTNNEGGSDTVKATSIMPKNAKMFIPELSTNRPIYLPSTWYETTGNLGAQFLFLPGPFSGQSVWSILMTYVNSPVDEMYTCLRVDPYGYIMPTVVVRQTSFNSMPLADKYGGKEITPFVSLPRWVIDDSIISNIRHGTSESQRLNYIHLLGKDIAGTSAGAEATNANVRNPPLADLADIARSGLKMKMGLVNANMNEKWYDNEKSPGSKWQNIVADGSMNAHLKHYGQIMCRGISEPICEGDNVEADGMLFHIERVSHAGSVSMTGHKVWNTSLDISNGISLESDNNRDSHFAYHSDDIESVEPTNGE
jgi:hypothetical protein